MLVEAGKFFENFKTDWDRARKRIVEYGGKKLGDDGHIVQEKEEFEDEICESEI